MSVEILHLTKIYGQQKAIDDISFTVQSGAIVGFLGPNGAGKSTTMKVVSGFLQPDQGSVKVNGMDISKESISAKRIIGYLPESNPLYAEMYIKEYLEFIGSIHYIPLLKQRVEEVIDITGLRLECKKKIGQVSKGYKQRTGLAAALIHDPQVLILDEPTSGLDPSQIIEIRELIKQLGKDKTVLFSSHILQEVEAMCERVIIINKGKIVADDNISALKQNNTKLSKVFLQFDRNVPVHFFDSLTSAKKVSQEANNSWIIETNDPEHTSKQILQLSLQHNLNIVSLQNEKSTLEEIFINLTS